MFYARPSLQVIQDGEIVNEIPLTKEIWKVIGLIDYVDVNADMKIKLTSAKALIRQSSRNGLSIAQHLVNGSLVVIA